MKKGMTIGEKHTYWDFDMITKSPAVISPPIPKTNIIDIPGSDNVIDLTESLTGQVHYERRKITGVFVISGDPEKQNNVYTDVLNHLQGQRMKIVLDNDPEYYYTGRVQVKKWEPGQFYAKITIEADVDPYKTARFVAGKKVL